MADLVQLTKDKDIAINNPPVNALSPVSLKAFPKR
jgi:hypothetical protein